MSCVLCEVSLGMGAVTAVSIIFLCGFSGGKDSEFVSSVSERSGSSGVGLVSEVVVSSVLFLYFSVVFVSSV